MDDGFRGLRLTNTLTRAKEEFRPIDWQDASIADAEKRVRMYVCGPTVYDFAHIGNARPVIVFDVLFRLLRHLYGEDRVTYVRNITDVDDKINARAARDFPDLPLNEAIRRVTETTAAQFHADAAALGCLPPSVEPRATDFVTRRADGKPDMVQMIATLIEKGHAYEAGGEVLFDVTSMPDYGRLSNRRLEDQQAGARVAVESHKRSPGDFVLWKLSGENEPGWESPFGQEAWTAAGRTGKAKGRPGWHIECSVMSEAYLGTVFDIHGGGLDLIFPHHENEIAQSRCAHGTEAMAQVWMHNGFLQLEGKKMSKSDGNFVTIQELLETEKFGGRKWPGEVLRLAMLMTDYREPIDFSYTRLLQAESILTKLKSFASDRMNTRTNKGLWEKFFFSLNFDLNTPKAIAVLEEATTNQQQKNEYTVYKALKLLGFKQRKSKIRQVSDRLSSATKALYGLTQNEFEDAISSASKGPFLKSGNLKSETVLMDAIAQIGLLRKQYSAFFSKWEIESKELRDTTYNFFISNEEKDIRLMVERRLREIKRGDYIEADRIRNELLAQGIQLKDGKDPVTGERITTWEVKR